LRHSYATHALHGGAYVRDLQVVMGHDDLETTMGYLHAEAGRVASPLQSYSPATASA
jgi:integrase/recombinase XerD